MKKYSLRLFFILVSAVNLLVADEGMYPLSEIQKLQLKAKGLRVTASDIYNPGKVGLIDAIVQVGGCTGSFVSNDGLIITNHHCAFGAVQAASTADHDYVTNGYLAQRKGDELQAKGYTVRITERYRDVSKEVLGAVSDTMDFVGRSKAIEKRSKEIVAETEKQNPGKRAEVSVMFAGKSYILFVYTFLKDVRVVYVPPRSIGEFGGENDNWVWPRHTGDFSFLRAYVAPDGGPADYSPANIPYHPKKFLIVNAEGVDDGDAVFILGYPGRTFRHRTSHYLAYEERVRMPYIADLYQWEIGIMQKLGARDRTVALKHDARIKGLANVMKNYRGKLKGMKHIGLTANKQLEEGSLQQFIDANPKRNIEYGRLFADIGSMFEEMTVNAQYELTLDNLLASSTMLNFGSTIYLGVHELEKPDLERESPYMERNFSRTKENMKLALNDYYEETDRTFLKEMLMRAAQLTADHRIAAVDSIVLGRNAEQAIDGFLERAFRNTKLSDPDVVAAAFTKSSEEIDKSDDPFISLAKRLYPAYQQLKETRQRRDGALSKLYAKLIDVKQEYLKKDFIPDANSTLRFTFGRIQGYSPADALYASPLTTLKGVIDKTTGEEPYNTPSKLIDLYHARNFGRFKHKKLKDVPVALLYNLDTTGGNSGSPLLDAQGRLVGVNFDRAYEATINDYAWNQEYSRSIAVDIRYVLWVLEKFAGADDLLREMGVRGS